MKKLYYINLKIKRNIYIPKSCDKIYVSEEIVMMFEYTDLEKEKVINGYFYSIEPLKLKLFPPKQKKQYITLCIISEIIEPNRAYSEKELNGILKNIYPDFVTLRRGLIDYKIMDRDAYGKEYKKNN